MNAQRIAFLCAILTTIIFIAMGLYILSLKSIGGPHVEGGPAFAQGVPLVLCALTMLIIAAIGFASLIVSMKTRKNTEGRWRLYVSLVLLSPSLVVLVLFAIVMATQK